MIKINNFQGELTDISAKKEALAGRGTYAVRPVLWTFWLTDVHRPIWFYAYSSLKNDTYNRYFHDLAGILRYAWVQQHSGVAGLTKQEATQNAQTSYTITIRIQLNFIWFTPGLENAW